MPHSKSHALNSIADTFQSFMDNGSGINETCKLIAKRLKSRWTWKYIYHVYRGTVQPGRDLIKALNALKIPKPSPKRNRKIVEATSKKQLDEWNTLTADELRHALDREVILRRM